MMETFGEWLRNQRNERKLTREEFAKRVGCSVALLRKIEDGERRPSSQIAELIAACLNILPVDRPIFVKVARGELGVDRLNRASKPPAAADPQIGLPVLPTPLVGRQRELEELGRLLNDPGCRLLSLVGPGGIGKTRLAIEAASRTQAGFANGAYFATLAHVNSARFIVPVVADALGFPFESAARADPKTQLFSFLKEKQTLLLADNLEHLLSAPGIEVLAELLATAPRVKLLTTSRESLGLQGEWVFEVQGLPVPESGGVEDAAPGTSVELFLQRARRAHVGFNATPRDYPAIVRICRLVDGMPLGIELAAAWVRTLACDEIAREIERGLDFLSVSMRDLPTRHRSMRAVFDHSWKLLSEHEQAVLLRLSVFRGGFRREAAEEVAHATLPVLSALVTKSLLRRGGAGRYDLHELIRQFAGEHLSKHLEEQTATQTRHGGYYLRYFGQADGRLRSSAQREALAELTVEMDNFRAAWDWAITHGKFALIEQSMRAFAMFYDTRGWLQEGLDTLGRAVSALETARGPSTSVTTNQVALGHVLVSRSVLASRLGQYEQAQAMLEHSLEILRPLNEPRVLVESVTALGLVMEFTGNYPKALELYSEGLEIAMAIGDRWFAALCNTCIAGLVGITQTLATPENTYEQLRSAVADWRAIGDPRFTAIGLNLLGWNALALGLHDEARALLDESASLGLSVGDRWGLGFAYRGLGVVAQAQGEHREAVAIFRKSLDTLAELGARQDVARVVAEMGRSVFALGNDLEAERMWRESLRIAMETRGMFVALEALVGIASLQAKRGDFEHALVLLLIVLNHPSSTEETRQGAARLRTNVESQLTPLQMQTSQTRAKSETFETVVATILAGTANNS